MKSEILKSIDNINFELDRLRNLVLGDKTPDSPQVDPVPKPAPEPQPTPVDLGPMPFYDDPLWPVAVAPNHIVTKDSPEELKTYRANQIIQLVGFDCTDKVVLDFGCGEGHLAFELAHGAKTSIGYDIVADKRWGMCFAMNLHFTTDKEILQKHAPYNVIMMYDVIDHIRESTVDDVLALLYSLLADDGKIFVRTHPWTSRHGGHLYEKVNKAFLHLALSGSELAAADLVTDNTLRVSRPMATYESAFRQAGFKQVYKKPQQGTPIEDYFNGAILSRIIKNIWPDGIEVEHAKKIVNNEFIDYVLTK